jgi:hypothetical protein
MYGRHTNADVRTTTDGKRVGPKMHEAVLAVATEGAYASKNKLAQQVGPNGSQDYGYRIVDRCVGSLLALDTEHPDATPQGRGAVVLTDAGRRYLAAHTDVTVDTDTTGEAR